jgi:aminoglycoside phosphotransferase (APT) family kinase protein
MKPVGPQLAEGRDSVIYEHGPGRVLRIPRDGRSLDGEAAVMRYVRAQGYPAPEVHESGPGYLVMERVDGPTMLDALVRQPHRMGHLARTLADLHVRLHALAAPDGLPRAGVPGDRLLHRDLHPLNVLMAAGGPVVIDWTNAAAGSPAYDVADTWVLFAVGEVPGGAGARVAATLGSRVFLRSFLRSFDRDEVRAAIPAAVEHRLSDRNMSEGERSRMRRMAARASAGTGRP